MFMLTDVGKLLRGRGSILFPYRPHTGPMTNIICPQYLMHLGNYKQDEEDGETLWR
jgi:hypothetical protein